MLATPVEQVRIPMSSSAEIPTFDSFYQLPIYYHDSVEALTLPVEEGIHYITAEGWLLPVYIRQRSGPLLTVGFSGAIVREQIRLPYFEGLRSFKGQNHSLCLFSDPVLLVSNAMTVAWYVGTTNFDLVAAMTQVVKRVQALCQATHLMFTGGSGGGFAALMMSHRFPESLAYVFNPQINILQYNATVVANFLNTCFPEVNPHEPQIERRLNCLIRYREGHQNKIYYLNNASDHFHRKNFAEPFAVLFGISTEGGVSEDGTVHLVIGPFAEGHAAPPIPVYFDHMEKALTLIGL